MHRSSNMSKTSSCTVHRIETVVGLGPNLSDIFSFRDLNLHFTAHSGKPIPSSTKKESGLKLTKTCQKSLQICKEVTNHCVNKIFQMLTTIFEAEQVLLMRNGSLYKRTQTDFRRTLRNSWLCICGEPQNANIPSQWCCVLGLTYLILLLLPLPPLFFF
jgi:hypothetical protein